MKSIRTAAKTISAGTAAYECLRGRSTSALPQRAVTSIDPNDIIGPPGPGASRFITGTSPLSYQVLFENLPAATAPAQRVEISNQLDPAVFDPELVMFDRVQFGSTEYSLPYPVHSLDETIDLRRSRDLLVHVTAA